MYKNRLDKNVMKISIVINTYNAERYLEKSIQSVTEFDEIVICDMESTDSTLDIARKYNCKIVTFPKGNCTVVEPARNFAISHASNPWVLVLDSDEVVTTQLKDYLYDIISQPNCPDGLYIPRKSYFMDRFMHAYYPDQLMRFFKKDSIFWPPYVHSIPVVQGNVDYISSSRKELALVHLVDESIWEIVRKINDYTTSEVERRKNKNYGIGAYFYRPFVRFFKAYVIKKGFLDGNPGFIRALFQAVYQVVMISKIIEAKKKNNK